MPTRRTETITDLAVRCASLASRPPWLKPTFLGLEPRSLPSQEQALGRIPPSQSAVLWLHNLLEVRVSRISSLLLDFAGLLIALLSASYVEVEAIHLRGEERDQ